MSNYIKKPANEFQETMQIKRENIAEAQKRKNTSIQQAGLQRDATILAAARIQADKLSDNWNRELVEREWEYWHNFLNNKLTEQELGF